MDLKNFGGFTTTDRAKWFSFENDKAKFLVAPNDDPELGVGTGYYGVRLRNRMLGDDPALIAEINDAANLKDAAGYRERLLRCYAESCLLDWENVEYDGQPFPYSKENAYKLLSNFTIIYDQIVLWSLELQNERVEAIEALKKTSKE